MSTSNLMISMKETLTYPNGTISTIEYNISVTDWIRLRNSLEITRNLSNFHRVSQPTSIHIPRRTPAPTPVPIPTPTLNEQRNIYDYDYTDMPPLEQLDPATYTFPPSNYNNDNLPNRPIFSHLTTSRLLSTRNGNIRYITLRDILPQLFNLPTDDFGLTQQEFASSITEQVVSSSDNFEDCSICKESINVGDNIIKLNSCNHIFHKNCIEPWVFSSNRTNCPLCRTEIYVE